MNLIGFATEDRDTGIRYKILCALVSLWLNKCRGGRK